MSKSLFFDSDNLECMAYNFHGMAGNIVRNCVFFLAILKAGCGMAKAYFNSVGPYYDMHAV